MIGDIDPFWQRIELRHLIALRAVARTGSFRRAAASLGYSLSTLSEQVASLERLVGQRLVERPGGRRAVSITPAGLRLLEHADEIAARIAAARADLEAIRLARPTLRLGIFQSVAVRLLPGILRRLTSVRPALALELIERVDDALLLTLIASGDIDATFTALPVDPGPFATAHLLDDPYLLLAAADGPLADHSCVSPDELVEYPLIDHRELRPVHHGQERLPRGIRPPIAARSDDNATIHALVGAGIGVAILPRLSIDPRDPAVRAIPFDPPVAPRRIALAWHHDRRPDGLEDLLAAARHEASRLAPVPAHATSRDRSQAPSPGQR